MNCYPEGADPGQWTSCSRCGKPIPCDTNGNPYSHTC